MESLSGQVAIAGVADTEVGKVPGKGPVRLCAEAALGALADAGLDRKDVDGLVTCNSMADPRLYHAETVAEYLQIAPPYCVGAAVGGGAAFAALYQAALAVHSGLCEVVVVSMADSLKSGMRREQALIVQSSSGHPEFETPYGSTVTGYYALIANAYLHEYGATPEHFAAVAVDARRHAANNPAAQMQKPIDVDDVLSSRMIADPLRLLDCSLVSDGGAALVLTTPERARDAARPPVYLLGAGEGRGHEHISQAKHLTRSGAQHAGERAYRMAGLGPQDMDFAELYDCFTPVVLIELEDLGFCPRGEAGPFVAEGRARLGGELPVNTHGGLLSHCHPGNPGSMFALTEAVRQLRRELPPERSVEGAETALVHAQGGILSSHCTLILGRQPR